MICRSIRKAASALVLASILTLSAAPAHALGRSASSRPRAGEDSWQMPEGGFFAFLLRLFAPHRGTMDPNGSDGGE